VAVGARELGEAKQIQRFYRVSGRLRAVLAWLLAGQELLGIVSGEEITTALNVFVAAGERVIEGHGFLQRVGAAGRLVAVEEAGAQRLAGLVHRVTQRGGGDAPRATSLLVRLLHREDIPTRKVPGRGDTEVVFDDTSSLLPKHGRDLGSGPGEESALLSPPVGR